MKILLLLALLAPASAFAFSTGDWQCRAEGYDQFHRRFTVESGRHLVIWEAERAALESCRAEGYSDCRVFYCSDMN